MALLFAGLAEPRPFSPALGVSLLPLFVLSPAALNGPRLSCPWHNHLQCFGISGGGSFSSLAFTLPLRVHKVNPKP